MCARTQSLRFCCLQCALPVAENGPLIERFAGDNGRLKQRMRRLPRAEWSVLIPDHHPGFIDWQTYEANQLRLAANTRPLAHRADCASRFTRAASRVSRKALYCS